MTGQTGTSLPTAEPLELSTTRRWRIDLAYDGTGFFGWASQPGLRTVQGVLEEWIGRILRLPCPPQLTVAGRTDAGVHARGQVAHFDIPAEYDASDLARRLSKVLSDDISVYRVILAPEHFDARFAASWRRYCYRLWDNESVPDPLRRHNVAKVAGLVNLELLDAAALRVIGLHDFVAFCKFRPGATAIRTLQVCQGVRTPENRAVEITFVADAFCHSMVRSLTGALISVAVGKRPLSWLDDLLKASSRQSGVPVMPASGLTLEEVGYPEPRQYLGRVTQAKSMRRADEVEPT